MKSIFLFLSFYISLGLYCNNMFAQDTNDDGFGFYMKNGEHKKQVQELNCYSFDELWVKFPIKQEMFGYDNVVVIVYELSYSGSVINRAGFGFDGNVFRAKFTGKEWGELKLFGKGVQKHTFKTGFLERGALKYAPSKKRIEGELLYFKVLGQTITGYVEEIVGNRIVKEPSWSDADLLYQSAAIPLNNREKKVVVNLPIGGQVGSLDVDLSQPCE